VVEHGGSAGSFEKGVRRQNVGGKKYKDCPFLLTTGYWLLTPCSWGHELLRLERLERF
jgi:hypothetical protein